MQPRNEFFTLPTELRHAIYRFLIPDKVHLSINSSSIQLSPCIQCDGDHEATGFCRTQSRHHLLNDRMHTKECALVRRLQSSWGWHWRCEEQAQGMQVNTGENLDDSLMTLLLACKVM